MVPWFEAAVANSGPAVQKGARSVSILTMWRLWRMHNTMWRLWRMHNDTMFTNLSPKGHDLVQSMLEEAKLCVLNFFLVPMVDL
jgi:hypothetical protein